MIFHRFFGYWLALRIVKLRYVLLTQLGSSLLLQSLLLDNVLCLGW